MNTDISRSKAINKFLGNGYTISFAENQTSKGQLINGVFGLIRDVNFSNIEIVGQNKNFFGLIRYNDGKMENCSFNDISIKNYAQNVGIIGTNRGYVNNIKLEDIDVSATENVGALIGYNAVHKNNEILITNVVAKNINISAKRYVGGIVGKIEGVLSNINVDNLTIDGGNDQNGVFYPTERIGGITGYGECIDSSISNSKIYASGNYIGGISGYSNNSKNRTNLNVKNLLISDYIEQLGSTPKTSNYVGGITGYSIYFNKCNVEGLVIGNKITNGDEISYNNFNGNNIGGLSGT